MSEVARENERIGDRIAVHPSPPIEEMTAFMATLKQRLLTDERSVRQIFLAAGVDRGKVYQFLRGNQDTLSVYTIFRLLVALGLVVVMQEVEEPLESEAVA